MNGTLKNSNIETYRAFHFRRLKNNPVPFCGLLSPYEAIQIHDLFALGLIGLRHLVSAAAATHHKALQRLRLRDENNARKHDI